ncbi:MAG: hypothetical protein ACUVUG_08000 [Candidatus Aminicenantia bacterium]
MNHTKQDLPNATNIDWVGENYLKLYNRKPHGLRRSICRLYHQAFENNDEKMINFYKCILDFYELHGFNNHIKGQILKINPEIRRYKCERI